MEDIRLIDRLFSDLENKDGAVRYNALQKLLAITENKVSWVYDKWFVLLDKLSSDNSYQRSIGLILLANLAKSDNQNRIISVLDNILELIDDKKFITSRQCIQNIWKISVCNKTSRKQIVSALERTYFNNIHLKAHDNLIKEDVIFSLYQISKYIKDQSILVKANELIEKENDLRLIKSLKKIMSG